MRASPSLRPRPLPAPRLAMTIIEVLVVTAIVGVLTALIVPAVQQARESARRASCANHLKQIGIAVYAFYDAQEKLPSSVRPASAGTVRVGVLTQLLPYLDEKTLWDRYDHSVN